MFDENFDRQYQAGRAHLNSAIDRLIDAVASSFAVMTRIQFDAPWKREDCAQCD